jgi:hypothetical protein
MTINSVNNIGIGTATPQGRLHVQGSGTTSPFVVSSSTGATLFTILANGNIGIGASIPGQLLTVGNASTTGVVARFQNSTGYCDINPTTTSLTCTSDERLKKNIEPLSSSSTLDILTKIQSLRPVSYNWNTEEGTTSPHTGFIAQEVQPLFPDLVATDPTGMLSVSYAGFVPYVVEALKNIITTLSSFKNSFASDTLNAKNKLCVGSTCVTESQLNILLQNANTSSVPQSTSTTSTAALVSTSTEATTTASAVIDATTSSYSSQ